MQIKEKIEQMRKWKTEIQDFKNNLNELQDELVGELQQILDAYVESKKSVSTGSGRFFKARYDDESECLSFKCFDIDEDLITMLMGVGYHICVSLIHDVDYSLIVYLF